jgi:bifunctional pyridoxal-dependent enzyme with beta-cystathionase and maltose regulon repressor activities
MAELPFRLRLAQYNRWEEMWTAEATEKAKDLIEKFNQFIIEDEPHMNVLRIAYTTEQSRGILDYVLSKVLIMLGGSGIFMFHKVTTRVNKSRVILELSEDKDYDADASENESDAESECSGCTACLSHASNEEDQQEDPSPVL